MINKCWLSIWFSATRAKSVRTVYTPTELPLCIAPLLVRMTSVATLSGFCLWYLADNLHSSKLHSSSTQKKGCSFRSVSHFFWPKNGPCLNGVIIALHLQDALKYAILSPPSKKMAGSDVSIFHFFAREHRGHKKAFPHCCSCLVTSLFTLTTGWRRHSYLPALPRQFRSLC